MGKRLKRFIALVCSVLCLGLCACTPASKPGPSGSNFKRGLNDYAFTKASFSAVDRENRAITTMSREKTDHERYVGVFYFLWMGTHPSSAGVYDVTKLQQTEAGAKAVMDGTWELGQKIPGTDGLESPALYVHWTTEPLYGYYNSCDPWVISRHIELLTMADVDFVFFDTTNGVDYHTNNHLHPNRTQVGSPTYAFLDTLLEYQDQGWDVPQVVFYTNNKSKESVQSIYDNFYVYENGKYDSLWFAPFGKPMIVGTTERNKGASDQGGDNLTYVSQELQAYFDVRESQWPNQGSKDWGFPWMDWTKGHNYYFSENKMVNVNVAQHGETETSYSCLDNRTSRGYDEENDTVEENWAAGKNIEDQWEDVFYYEENGKSVEMVTVSCWNEWLAWKFMDGRQNPDGSPHVLYVDNFNAEHSRDMEMDKYYYKDNFYLQLVRNVRRYKYGENTSAYTWDTKTVKSIADMSTVKAAYKDMTGDARKRDFWSFDIRSKDLWYTDESNRNDIAETRVIHDENNLYMLITTVDDITEYEGGENWMNVLIKTGKGTNFEGYSHIINRKPEDGITSVEKSTGGWNWQESGTADMVIEGNKMLISVPLSALGFAKGDKVQIEFKVADNVTNYDDIMDYYVTGDSAPIGRLNYNYGY